MKCPYCVGEVDGAALACPHCARDLYLFKPLLVQMGALESELASVKERLGLLEAQREESEATGMPAAALESLEGGQATPDEMSGFFSWLSLLPWLWLTPLAMLIAAHFLITVVYDVNMIWLRVLSLVIPLPFGYLLMSGRFRRFPVALLAAFLVACLAVVAMSGVVHLVDGTAVLPQDRHGWQEFIEYAASITFSFATGMVLGRMLWRHRQAVRLNSILARKLVGLVMGSGASIQKINAAAELIQQFSKSIAATGTTIAALYTGLHAFL